MSRRTSPAAADRNAAGGAAVQGWPVQGLATVVDVVELADGRVDVELVELELVELADVVDVVWAPAAPAANSPRHPTSSTAVRLGTSTSLVRRLAPWSARAVRAF
jgi:hypothetical protein